METSNIQTESQDYQITDGHVISKDFKAEGLNYTEFIINDRERSFSDKRHYDKEKRIKDLKLCIRLDNYFENLASILNFAVEADKAQDTNLGIILKKIEKDLLYLQENYTIEKRGFKDYSSSINIF